MSADTLGLLAMAAVFFVAVCLIAYSRLAPRVKQILVAALGLRALTSWYYYNWTWGPNGRGNDASDYYDSSIRYVEYFSRFDFSPLFDERLWYTKKWWGTQFVHYPAGLVLTVLGPNRLAAFLFFSLLAFVGLMCFAVVFHRAYPHVKISRYLVLLLLFPSLAFWTSAIGKEAIILFGMGLAALGLLARKGGPNWILAGCGLFLVFAIRPQVAAVVVMALILAQTFSRKERLTFFSTLRLSVVLVAGAWTIHMAMQELGAGGLDDISGIQRYVEAEATTATSKGTAVADQAPGLSGAPIALFNILFRPFLWEARSGPQLMAALEVTVLWFFAFRNRRRLWDSIKKWRSDASLAFSLLFVLVYATTLGMLIVNVGIIVRQRIFIFPCLFMLFLAQPVARRMIGRPAGVLPVEPHRPTFGARADR